MTSTSVPTGSFSVWQRLLRGYGPLVGLAVMLVLMSILVPSKVPADGTVSTGPGSGDDSSLATDGSSSTAGGTAGGSATQGGQTTSGGQAGLVKGPGVVPCPPDRQYQVPGDPYSPPCVGFQGDNGGATHRGVTRDEVRIAYRLLNEKGFQQTLAELAGATLVDTPTDIRRTVEGLAEYFNSRYQFYGRKLKFEFYNGQGSNTDELLGRGRDKAENDADRVANTIKAFADLSGTSEPYAGALARRGVVAFGTPYLSRDWHVERKPYAWSIATDGTKVANFGAEYALKRLCGGTAEFAGGTGTKQLKGKDRKFGTLVPDNSWYQVSVALARETFSKGGCDPGENVQYKLDLGTMSNQASNIVARLQSAGVTTVFCGCDPILPVFLSGAAARQGYFPEFIIVGTALTDTDIVGQLWNQDFATHAFGISSLTEPLPASRTLGYAAYKSVRQDEPAFSVDLIYYQMAQLAIGIHMAGPNLTPATFEKGMFDYPPRLGPVGLWDYGPQDYTAADDVREIYWDRNATSKYNQKQGAFIESNPGKRYRVGQLPPGKPDIPPR